MTTKLVMDGCWRLILFDGQRGAIDHCPCCLEGKRIWAAEHSEAEVVARYVRAGWKVFHLCPKRR